MIDLGPLWKLRSGAWERRLGAGWVNSGGYRRAQRLWRKNFSTNCANLSLEDQILSPIHQGRAWRARACSCGCNTSINQFLCFFNWSIYSTSIKSVCSYLFDLALLCPKPFFFFISFFSISLTSSPYAIRLRFWTKRIISGLPSLSVNLTQPITSLFCLCPSVPYKCYNLREVRITALIRENTNILLKPKY
jgi:hypothetical protein